MILRSKTRQSVRVLHLYDRYLNIYADRGNLRVLAQRLDRRGMELQVSGCGLGESPDFTAVDLIYVGGGQDRDQRRVAAALADGPGAEILSAAAGGTPVLAVCGGYQLLGKGYTDVSGHRQPGVGLFDADTVAGDSRLIGNVVIEADLPALGARPAQRVRLAGFENHAGQTTLGPDATPLGRVIAGHGNDGHSGWEGCIAHHAIGTYLHGPLLPRNPELSDWLLTAALQHQYGSSAPTLEPLDDDLEQAARTRLVGIASG